MVEDNFDIKKIITPQILKMTTQLQLLDTPQTSALVESNTTASILFDSKDAATKDRKTIFEIGIKGLEELIGINPVFNDFKHTLFDETTIEFDRSTETSRLNYKLDNNIKKFLLQLSPYFIRQSAHKCLEWLIRRYCIHFHNVNEIMALILPYHETMIFVKFVHILHLRETDEWYWIRSIQAPGVSLSKDTIISRAASHPHFLKIISDTTVKAVEELNPMAHNLQTLFAFYLTVTLGALDVTTDIQSAVASISCDLLKGLSSNVPDFRAASMSLIGFLVTKVAIKKYLKLIIEKLDLSRRDLVRESLVMLVIVYQTQSERTEVVNDLLLAKMIDNPSTLTLIGSLYKENIDVLSLCLPLIATCVKNICNNKKTKHNQNFVESLLSKLSLKNDDVEAVIKCILKTLQQMDDEVILMDNEVTQMDDEVIQLDDDVSMVRETLQEIQWFANLLRQLETRYSDVFDAVKRNIMFLKDEISSGHAKSLKHIFGYILCFAYNGDPTDATTFVNLYHSDATNRIQAVKTLVNQLSTMPFSDNRKNFLAAGIIERLSDSSHDVVTEVLKFQTKDLIEIVGEQNLIRKLKVIIDMYKTNKKWQGAVGVATKHITSEILFTENNEVEILIAVWPYMFPYCYSMINQTKIILASDIADRFSILKRLKEFEFKNDPIDLPKFNQFVDEQLKTFLGMIKISEIVQYVNTIPDEEMSISNALHIINLLNHLLLGGSDHKLSTEVLKIVSKFSDRFGIKDIDINSNVHFVRSTQALPVQSILKCIQTVIGKTSFSTFIQSEDIDFTCKNDALTLIVKIYENLCTGLYSPSKNTNRLFNKAMLEFLHTVLPDRKKQLQFFSNFFINHYIEQLSDTANCISIDPTLQLRSMRLFNAILATGIDTSIEITMESFIRIISGLTSPFPAIRITTCNTLELFNSLDLPLPYSNIVGELFIHRERLSFNSNELSVSLFHIRDHHKELFEYVRQRETAMILKAALLKMLPLVTKLEYLSLVVDVVLAVLEEVDITNKVILGPHESIIVYEAIQRFTEDAIPKISNPGKTKRFFEKMLQHSNVFLRIDNKVHSVTVLVMKLNLFKSFKDLSKKQKMFIIESVIKSATFSESAEVRSEANTFFKETIDLDEKMNFNILAEMAKVTPFKTTRSKESKCFSQELLQTREWKCGVTLLEFLHEKSLRNPLHLLRQLFLILEKCLKFDDQSIVYYTKYLVLGNISNCCEYISASESVLESHFKIELVVKCIRSTSNPQSHHYALQLLTKLSSMMPKAVLHNMVDLFTVGTSVVCRDYTYIYQLISNIIKSIVPILKENHAIQVLEAFCDAILNVPTHRRSSLYVDLLKTLGPMQFLWKFLAILFEKDFKDPNCVIKLTLIAIEITNQFDCEIIIGTCCELIKYLRQQLKAVTKKGNEMDPNLQSIFNVDFYSPNESAMYRHRILHFISVLTKETSEFSEKWAFLSDESQMQHKNRFEKIVPAVIDYIRAEAKVPQNVGENLSTAFFILNQLLGILYSDMLIPVVDALLCEENEAEVRLKVLDLLNSKFESPKSFNDCKRHTLSLLDALMDIVKSIDPQNADKLMRNATSKQNALLQSEALISIQIMSKFLTSKYPKNFAEVLILLSKILKDSYKEVQIRYSAYLIQCIGEVCANLRADAVALLNMFMGRIIKILNMLITGVETNLLYIEVTLNGIHRIVETLLPFLNKLPELIASLSILWSHLQKTSSNASQKSLSTLNKIWQTFSLSFSLQALIPLIEYVYPNLLAQQKFNAVGPLMILLLNSFRHVTNADLVQNYNDLTTFLISVLDFRTKFHLHLHSTEKQRLTTISHSKCTAVDVVEDFIIETFVGLFWKLSDTPLRQFHNKVCQWSIENDGPSFDRAVTFYRLSSKITESLKPLLLTEFATYHARYIVENSADLLKKNFTKKEIEASSTTSVTLIYSILDTLNNIFLYSKKLIDSHLFKILLEPLVNILDNEDYLKSKNIEEILPECLAHFAVAANDNVLWKLLNNGILRKTKSDSVITRRCALCCSTEVIIKLGEDSTLLQDIIQPYSELLHDNDPEIRAIRLKNVKTIAEVMNENVGIFLS